MRLKDEEIRSIILYVLAKYESSIAFEELLKIISWDNDIVDYFTTAQKLCELKEDELIEEIALKKTNNYLLTNFGKKTIESCREMIPNNIKHKIKNTINHIKYDNTVETHDVQSCIVPVDKNRYAVKFTLKMNEICLLDLILYIGGYADAQKISSHLKRNSEKAYMGILTQLTKWAEQR